MERTMSVEDKIRRAEEIYYRRKEREIPTNEILKNSENKSKNKKDIKLLKKMIKQIIVCLTIYALFYTIINSNYIFSEDFTNKAREILSQDINITEMYSTISNKVLEIINKMKIEENYGNTEQEQQNEEQQNKEQLDENIQNNNENIGGAEELLINEVQSVENSEEEGSTLTEEVGLVEEPKQEEITLTQMEQDAYYIKSTINFIKPVNGIISSMYGVRNPTTPTVPKNHTGTDIAAKTGTKIISATEGTVILASSKGDYGKHLKIQINDVILVYAHCNKLYVKEGDKVAQGQEIAEVGSTGNTTGPHLHFEVRYQDRYVNPQMILEL